MILLFFGLKGRRHSVRAVFGDSKRRARNRAPCHNWFGSTLWALFLFTLTIGSRAETKEISLPRDLDKLTPALMEKHKVPGVGIVGIKKRRVAWERYYGVRHAEKPERVDGKTIFEAASLSKLPAAYAAMKLVEQGKLDLDRPLSEYLERPYLTNAPLHLKISARMVLAHTTGFPNWRKGGWRSNGPLPVLHEPGTKFGYSGEGFLYLQRVMEHITGEPFEPYIQRSPSKQCSPA
jgi:CubicO group peptidase (beta-lactamase class C family)